MTIVTDASSDGWGGHLGDQTASGIWQPQWKSRHINWLKLQAVWLTLQHFLPQIGGTVVEVLSDNMTTVSYINRQGGTQSPSLCRLALDLLDWCDEHQIFISAVHLAVQREQCPSGCTVTRQLLPDGVGPPLADLRVPVAGLGSSVCRHECSTPGVLLPGIGYPGQRVGCVNHELGYGSWVCVPPDRTDPSGAEKTS